MALEAARLSAYLQFPWKEKMQKEEDFLVAGGLISPHLVNNRFGQRCGVNELSIWIF